ncbi:MAG: 1,4-beta-glucanase [Synechococcus sp. CPC35]|nr:1,4-beta-glucanase [Synechococcus sp. CPC35]
MESNQLKLSGVDSAIWWGGLTANLTFTNYGDEPLSDWTYTFLTHHRIQDEAWGLQVIDQSDAGNGLSRITIQGHGYGQRINPGDSITIGFNAEQGIDLGTAGKATQDQVLLIDRSHEQEQSDQGEVGEGGMDHSSDDHSSHHRDAINHDAINHDDMGHGTSHANSGLYQDINVWGNFHGSNHNSEHNELVGGRTAITTEALVAYNAVRAFAGLQSATIEQVGQWAFDNQLTNNSQAWGNDLQGVGLWYAMQGAKVAWIADERYDPQILADIQRTARLGNPDDVIQMVQTHGHKGFADFLQQNNLQESFINTLKMEPHYGGWMHGRTHGFLNIENGAIAHDINHLTVLGWDQSEPFMNDTFDWPQWPALNVDDQTVINYYQSIVSLGNPLADNLESLPDRPAIQTSLSESQPESQPEQEQDPATVVPSASTLDIESSPTLTSAGGQIWWGGLTANLTFTNQSDEVMDDWDFIFTTPHRIQSSQ